jgi:signal transduction histidine kinase
VNPDPPDQENRSGAAEETRGHQEPTREPHRGSVRGVAIVVVTAVLAIGTSCLLSGAARIGRPFPGFLVLENRIVLSIARPEWSLDKAARILFAEVIAINDRPVGTGSEVHDHALSLAPGTATAYRFRRGADFFREVIPVKRFALADYLALHATYFAVGLCFALAGLWGIWGRPALSPAPIAFFAFCQACALVLLTGADLYGPYWFTPLYYCAFSVAPAALLHFASSFPEPIGQQSRTRAVLITLLYGAGLLVASGFLAMADDAALFLPVLYTVYLLLANALLLYLARLLTSWWSAPDAALRREILRALLALLLSGMVAGVIFVTYPARTAPISPLLLVAPMAIFPLGTAAAVIRASRRARQGRVTSVQLRLVLLFLGAVQNSFLIGVAVYWLNASRDRLLDDFRLNQEQRARIDRFLSAATLVRDLESIAAVVQTVAEQDLVDRASHALERGATAIAQRSMQHLAATYAERESRLIERRNRFDRFAVVIVLGLITTGVAQAVVFMVAVRRWLILPINRLAAATSIIATGDLHHRVQLDSGDEFERLGVSINAMASSLAAIQRQADAQQEARRRAAGKARDAERRRLARELHDSVLQDLSGVKLRLEAECRRPTPNLPQVVDAVIGIVVDLRRLVDELRPPDLGTSSLADAVAAHAQVLARAHGVELELDLPPTVEVPDWATRDVYRIAQEAIANSVRHAAPKLLQVRLTQHSEQTVLEIVDDGAGFDLSRAAMGSGLLGMQERAAALGADLTISSAPGRGTSVRLLLPPARAEA